MYIYMRYMCILYKITTTLAHKLLALNLYTILLYRNIYIIQNKELPSNYSNAVEWIINKNYFSEFFLTMDNIVREESMFATSMIPKSTSTFELPVLKSCRSNFSKLPCEANARDVLPLGLLGQPASGMPGALFATCNGAPR